MGAVKKLPTARNGAKVGKASNMAAWRKDPRATSSSFDPIKVMIPSASILKSGALWSDERSMVDCDTGIKQRSLI